MIIREYGDSGGGTHRTVPDEETIFLCGMGVVWVGFLDGERCITVNCPFEVDIRSKGRGVWVKTPKGGEHEDNPLP